MFFAKPPTLWNLSDLPTSFTHPTEVPATSISVLCPREYINSMRTPMAMDSPVAMITIMAMSTGVEQGEENIAPTMPSDIAPIVPFF